MASAAKRYWKAVTDDRVVGFLQAPDEVTALELAGKRFSADAVRPATRDTVKIFKKKLEADRDSARREVKRLSRALRALSKVL
jgi:hypothetical protein